MGEMDRESRGWRAVRCLDNVFAAAHGISLSSFPCLGAAADNQLFPAWAFALAQVRAWPAWRPLHCTSAICHCAEWQRLPLCSVARLVVRASCCRGYGALPRGANSA